MLKIGLDYAFTRGGPDGGRHQPGRDLRARRSGGDDAGRPVSCRDAILRHGRLANAHIFGLHAIGVSAAAGIARKRSHQVRRSARAARRMQPNYLSTKRDRQTLVAGIRLARRLAATRALAPYVKREYRPGPTATTRRRPARVREEHRRHDLPPQRHVQDGRPSRATLLAVVDCAAPRARARGLARRRLRRHADAHVRQHQRPGRHDRGEGVRHDPRAGRDDLAEAATADDDFPALRSRCEISG